MDSEMREMTIAAELILPLQALTPCGGSTMLDSWRKGGR